MERIVHENQLIYVIADLHGRFNVISNVIDKNNLKDCILIVAGDIGLGFKYDTYYDDIFKDINEILIKNNIYCYLIRGNHDDPSYFSEKKINLSNIKTVCDYTVISVGNHNILCVGGGISIDRKYRMYKTSQNIAFEVFFKGKSIEEANKSVNILYWSDEAPVFDSDKLEEIKNGNISIDYVITHTSPSFCFKKDKDGIKTFLSLDKELTSDLDKERNVMDLIYKYLSSDNKIDKWVYGHFHKHNIEVIDGTEFIALTNADYELDISTLNNNDSELSIFN